MLEILSTIATAIGVPLLLASIAFFLAGYLGKEIGIGPVKAPAPEPGKRDRWMRAATGLAVVSLALLGAAAFLLVRAATEEDEPPPSTATPAVTTGANTPRVSTPATPGTPTAAPPTATSVPVLTDFAGEWRNRQASAGDLIRLTITVTVRGGTSTKVSGAYQDRLGVLLLPDRDGVFSGGVIRVSEDWPLGTSVDRLRLTSIQLRGANLEVVVEHCVVGQLGTTCTPRTNTLVR